MFGNSRRRRRYASRLNPRGNGSMRGMLLHVQRRKGRASAITVPVPVRARCAAYGVCVRCSVANCRRKTALPPYTRTYAMLRGAARAVRGRAYASFVSGLTARRVATNVAHATSSAMFTAVRRGAARQRPVC